MSKKKRQSEAPGTPASAEHAKAAGRVNLRTEDSEPFADSNPLPMALIILLTLLLFAADMQLMANRGEFESRVYEPFHTVEEIDEQWPIDPAVEARKKGRGVYERVCAACHQGSGLGQAGLFPPLAGSDWVLEEGPNRIINLILHGIQGPITVNGQSYNNVMPPWGSVLSDADVAAVSTFIRSEWGNKAAPVTAEQVIAVRKAGADRAPWSAEDLLKVPAK